MWALRTISEKIEWGVTAASLPPILVNGLNTPRIVRNVVEAEFWLEDLKGVDGALFTETKKILMEDRV